MLFWRNTAVFRASKLFLAGRRRCGGIFGWMSSSIPPGISRSWTSFASCRSVVGCRGLDETRSRTLDPPRSAASTSSAMAHDDVLFDGLTGGAAGFALTRKVLTPVIRAGAEAPLGVICYGKAHARRRGASGRDPGGRLEWQSSR